MISVGISNNFYVYFVTPVSRHIRFAHKPRIRLKYLKNSFEVKEMLHQRVEKIKEEKNIGVSEFLDGEI